MIHTLVFVGLLLPSLHSAENGFVHPVIRVPDLAGPPEIDGSVGDDEWARAAVVTGVSGHPLGTPFLLPEAQQVTWYLGFHKDTLYLGMKSPHPEGTFPSGRVKEMDDGDVLWGDHVEVQVLTHKRGDAGKPGKGFYKMVINAWGAMHDAHFYNGTPGTEDFWSTGGPVKCTVTDRMWQLEMAIEASRIRLPSLNGKNAVIQLVRADSPTGIYFAGLVGGSWMAWQKFTRTDFDVRAPVFQVHRLGEIMAGHLDLHATLRGTGEAAQNVSLQVVVEDADGNVLHQEKREVTLTGGEQKLTMKKPGLAVSEVDIGGKRNYLEIKAVWHDGKIERVLYHNRSPFMKLTDGWREKYLQPWVNARPKAGDWDAVFAHWPYPQKAEAKVDVDFFGMSDAIRNAASFEVVVKSGAGKEIARQKSPMENGKGRIFFDVPELADGSYTTVFQLSNEKGTQVAEKTVEFVRKSYPWERNKLGLSNEVIPPFVPMELNGRVLHGGGAAPRTYMKFERKPEPILMCWGRAIQLGSNGLPEQIWATPPSGTCGRPEELLAAPIQFVLRSGGKQLSTEMTAKVANAQPHRIDVAASGEAGEVGLKIDAFEEYDGWYQVELRLDPAGAVPLDSMDLVIELRQHPGERWKTQFPVDTLYIQRMGGGLDGLLHRGIPEKPGICFKSTEIWPVGARTGPADIEKDWKSFLPILYAGNGDRGLWFFAWDDAGWTLKDDTPAVQVERLRTGNVQVRVRLIAGEVTLDKPRRLTFALQPAPIKKNDPQYRTRVDRIAHDTSGYRYYGDSVDSFALHTEEDFAELRKYLLYGNSRQDKETRYGHWAGRLGKMIREERADRVMLYGSQWMTGLGAEEFRTFGGEWLGRTNWKPAPDLKFSGKHNYGGTVKWDTPEELTPARVNWPQSFQDFFVWYHDKLIDKVGINGTWWDNCYSGFVTEYDPALGRLDSKWNIPYRRALCKRLNVIGWERLRPPCWSMNTQVEMSWCQVFWIVEGIWGPGSKDISAVDHFRGVDVFRAAARPKSTNLVTKKTYMRHYRGSTPELDRKMTRSADGMLLSHDISPAVNHELTRKLKYAVDYENTDDCLFMGYWSTGMFVKPTEGLLASLYMNRKHKASVIVFFNTSSKDVAAGGTWLKPAGVLDTPNGIYANADREMEVSRIYDLETGKEIRTSYRDRGLVIDESLVVKKHEYRVVSVEGK